MIQDRFKVKIQNLGKLKDATIQVAPFTVLAGQNNTGKSFFSKAMYSVFNAMNANPVGILVESRSMFVRKRLRRIRSSIRFRGKGASMLSIIDNILEAIQRMIAVADAYQLNSEFIDEENKDNSYIDIRAPADELKEIFVKFQHEVKNLNKYYRDKTPFRFLDEDYIKNLEYLITKLCDISEMSLTDIIIEGLSIKISTEFFDNFQVGGLNKLKGKLKKNPTIDINDAGSFIIDSPDSISFEVSHDGLLELQQFSRVVYLESPMLWKLKEPLERIGREQRQDEIIGVPGYFYDLVNELGRQYKGGAIANDKVQDIAKKIGGKVVIDELGHLYFNEKGVGTFHFPIVATGVTNLGFIAMLIERRVIDKHTFLFIDEPEAHLHPEWQVEMVELLFALAENGVHVVIATHSVDILKWLKVHVKKKPKDKELIALNHFTKTGVSSQEENFSQTLADIQKDLTDPFFNLHMREL